MTESGQILAITPQPGDYISLRVAAPTCAQQLQPGQYLTLDGRPWAVLMTGPGWVDCLQQHGQDLAVAQPVTVAGPLGPAFALAGVSRRGLLLGGDSGIAPLVLLAHRLHRQRPRIKPLLLLSATTGFPFQPQPSRIMVPGLPGGVIAAMPLLEDWGIPSRLVSITEQPGCFAGNLESLAEGWLQVCQGNADVTVYACGPAALLDGTRRLAARHRLPCQTVPLPPAADA
jgi:dihydroorotate dehydrogenase electron transfer subunit